MIAMQVGVNDGKDSFCEECHKTTYDSIYLFEPMVSLHPIIHQQYAGLNALVYEFAVTPDKRPSAPIYILHETGGHNSILNRRTHPWKEEGLKIESIEVPCITINQFCETMEISAIDLLQIDTEGLDDEIILSIDFEKVKIKKIIWERWSHANDDDNGRYETGPSIRGKLLDKLLRLGYSLRMHNDANYCAEIL